MSTASRSPNILEPAGGGEAPQSILSSASCRGLGFGVGCGLAFCVAFGRSAVVSFVLVVGSRSVLVLVLVVPRGGGFVCPLLLVLVWCWFWSSAFGLGFGRVRWFRFIFPLFGA